jgi:uncharacterized protein
MLEDIYLPYRPKRRTRATIAKEKGLEPLADLVLAQTDADPAAQAAAFVSAEKGVESVEDALAGARDILAERASEDAKARARMRELYAAKATFRTKVTADKEADPEAAKFRDYFAWEEPVAAAPSHRILAMRRGEEAGFLILRATPPEEEAVALLDLLFVKAANAAGDSCTWATPACNSNRASLARKSAAASFTRNSGDSFSSTGTIAAAGFDPRVITTRSPRNAASISFPSRVFASAIVALVMS